MAKAKLKPLESTTANNVLNQMKIVDAPEEKPEPEIEQEVPEKSKPQKTSPSTGKKSAPEKKRIGLNIVITPEQNEALDILAKYNNISKTQLCRNIVDSVIKRNKEKIERYKEFFEIIS